DGLVAPGIAIGPSYGPSRGPRLRDDRDLSRQTRRRRPAAAAPHRPGRHGWRARQGADDHYPCTRRAGCRPRRDLERDRARVDPRGFAREDHGSRQTHTRGSQRLRPFMLNAPLLILPLIVVLYLINSIKILAEYERGVIFRLGKLLPQPKGPGVALVFFPIDRMVRVGLRTVVLDVPPQDVITRDNVSVKVNAVVYFRVIDPRRAI